MSQSTPRRLMYGHGPTLTLYLPAGSPVICVSTAPRRRAAKQQSTGAAKPSKYGGTGGSGCTLKIAFSSGGLVWSTVHAQEALAGPRPTCCTLAVPPSQTGSLSLAGMLASPFVPSPILVPTGTHVRPALLLLSNSLNAWPVFALACRPLPHPAGLYIPASPSEPRRPSSTSAVTTSFLFLFLFLLSPHC